MTGSEVFRFATRTVAESCEKVLGDANLTVEDVDLFVPHQANIRIIESASRRLGFTERQVFANLDRYGNTSCASIPICLHEASQTGRLRRATRCSWPVRRRAHLGLVSHEVGALAASWSTSS